MSLEFQPLLFQEFGSHAILISWPNAISESASREIYFFNQKINTVLKGYIVETVTAYCSLTVFVNADIDNQKFISELKELYNKGFDDIEINVKIWNIPVLIIDETCCHACCLSVMTAFFLPLDTKLKSLL